MEQLEKGKFARFSIVTAFLPYQIPVLSLSMEYRLRGVGMEREPVETRSALYYGFDRVVGDRKVYISICPHCGRATRFPKWGERCNHCIRADRRETETYGAGHAGGAL